MQADTQRRRARSISVPETYSLSSSLRSIDTLYEKLMHYLQENEQLKKQIQTNNEEYQSEITKLKEINSNLIEENARLEKALYNMNESKVAAQEAEQYKVTATTEQETPFQQNITSKEIKELMRNCTEYQNELNNTKKELQDRDLLIQSLSTQIKLKKEENEQLLEACNTMKSNVKNNHQAFNILTTSVKELVDECSHFRKDCTRVHQKFKDQFQHVFLKRSQRERESNLSLDQ